MSTKIYHGYRLALGTDIWDLTERLREQGNRVRDQLDMGVLETFAKGKDAPREQALIQAMCDWGAVNKDLGDDHRFHDAHRLSVTFIRDQTDGRILALLYCQKRELMDVWESLPEVEYYGYWNNSDPPEDCTEAEWAEREEVWERVLGMDPPLRRGISFDLRCNAIDGMVEMIYKDWL